MSNEHPIAATGTASIALATALSCDELADLKEMVAGLPATIEEASDATYAAWHVWDNLNDHLVWLFQERGVTGLQAGHYDLADDLPTEGCVIADQLREFCENLDQVGEDLGRSFTALSEVGCAQAAIEVLDALGAEAFPGGRRRAYRHVTAATVRAKNVALRQRLTALRDSAVAGGGGDAAFMANLAVDLTEAIYALNSVHEDVVGYWLDTSAPADDIIDQAGGGGDHGQNH